MAKVAQPMDVSLAALKRSPLYSEELGISLSDANDSEYFKWFLASLFFGGHITETIARHTYQAFVNHNLMTPDAILTAGLDYLVHPIMREGGYVRYDGRKSNQILRDCEQLMSDYDGSLKRLHEMAADTQDLEQRLQAFYGIGPMTMNIFLRELRPFWRKANPPPLPMVRELATALGIDLESINPKTLTFCRIEAGLIRQRKQLQEVVATRRQGENV